MAPNYIDFPERRTELRAEVGTLLESDDSRAGAVYRSSLDDVQAQRGTQTQATNEVDYILPGLLDGRIPAAAEPRKMVASRLRSWLNKKKESLSPELRADFEAQLEAIDALNPTTPATPAPRVFEVPENTDRVLLARARTEQARLRDYLLQGRTQAPCDLCGRLLPRDLLVAAHIAPRRDLDHAERTQFDRIAMIACLLGCDRLFELGYLTVDEEGTICPGAAGDELTPILNELAGRRCSAYSDDTAAAFAAHRVR
jgi:hypothetical protein